MYLKIQNPGVAPLEGYTVLGVSTTRNSGAAGTIGQFGSGSKQAIGLLLRQEIKPIVFLGKLRLEFDAEKRSVNDGLIEKDYRQVQVKLSGEYEGKTVRRTQDLGFALEFGTYDWNDISMAGREFVSNALDRTIREEGGFIEAKNSGRLEVCLVPDESVRAKDGTTRVFIPATPEILQFFSELPWRFLHFSEPALLTQRLLPKKMRGLRPNSDRNEIDTAVIYKNGVFVRRIKSMYPSLFDYNFGAELALDECRNVNDSTVSAVAGNVLRQSKPEDIAKLLDASLAGTPLWELNSIHSSYYSSLWTSTPEEKEKIAVNWRAAYKMVAGDAVACSASNGQIVDYVKRKGHTTALIHSDSILANLKEYGVKLPENVLSSVENDGMEECAATESAMEAAKLVWQWVEDAAMTNGRSFPYVKCFTKNMDAGTLIMGKYHNNTIYLNKSISDNGLCHELLTTTLEEMAHHITQSTDMSRDLQDFVFNLAVRLGTKKELMNV